jgi:hypothetical protein
MHTLMQMSLLNESKYMIAYLLTQSCEQLRASLNVYKRGEQGNPLTVISKFNKTRKDFDALIYDGSI